jgi:hypothetical protein
MILLCHNPRHRSPGAVRNRQIVAHAFRNRLKPVAATLLLSVLAACSSQSAPSPGRPPPHAASTSAPPTGRTQSTPQDLLRTGEGALKNLLIRDESALRRAQYTPDFHRVARLHDGTLLLIFHSVCTGSADGHCQAVDVFRNGEQRAIWHHQYPGVLAVEARPNGFSVKSVRYAPGDPLCCSSLPPAVHVYRWKGGRISESGALPGLPAG